MGDKAKARLWLQDPPRRQWVLQVTRRDNGGVAYVRTWFDESEYGAEEKPPGEVVNRLAGVLHRLAEAALAGQIVERRYTIKLEGEEIASA